MRRASLDLLFGVGIEQQAGSVVTSYGGNTVFNNAGDTFGLTQPKI